MAVKILKQEKNILELDLGEVDQSLALIIVRRLNETKGVEFAACKKEHPIIGTPHLIVRTKTSDPVKLVGKVLEELKTEVAEFRKQFSELVK